MIKYRPQRLSLDKSLEEMKIFNDIGEMLCFISESNHHFFAPEDIVISQSYGTDERIGWKSWRYVCTRYFNNKIIEPPLCIGMCDLGESE